LPRALTLGGTFQVSDKIYDGRVTATITRDLLALVGVQGGETLTLNGLRAAFGDPAIGVGKTVGIVAGNIGDGTGRATNYSLSLAGAPTTTATIRGSANGAGTGGDGATRLAEWDWLGSVAGFAMHQQPPTELRIIIDRVPDFTPWRRVSVDEPLRVFQAGAGPAAASALRLVSMVIPRFDAQDIVSPSRFLGPELALPLGWFITPAGRPGE
jgi:hypothetical protein